ncbi:hypothetical protein MJO29_000439 [Puccinia striiformis f. sp. tritici]|uniref:hypothetical protein n=1 Tax=Puccinia striiformis f. sp. tritici TaxID=168172 RepID=UPI0020081E02|nr:hypothetical protein Pst134EA_000418 [Puccinia striiformis f. sp. tritici]KAH9466578.1 hypothetical protein Pst134EB_001630 [Puccinia striiformis f. sp. tritici]KAH9473345.1 hypothetical protein Pst134EA_000418 [Puccinia striiformis f. sp. tritici]KAI7967162.1 hypothetical protein MJO29_000439 [Puccinia striiformis f. sp. tritici]
MYECLKCSRPLGETYYAVGLDSPDRCGCYRVNLSIAPQVQFPIQGDHPPNKPERPTEDTGIISALQCFFRTVLLINATPSHRFLNSTLRPTCAIIDRDLPADNCRDRFVFSCYLAPVLRLFRCMRSFECSVITESLISRLVTTARSFAIFVEFDRSTITESPNV